MGTITWIQADRSGKVSEGAEAFPGTAVETGSASVRVTWGDETYDLDFTQLQWFGLGAGPPSGRLQLLRDCIEDGLVAGIWIEGEETYLFFIVM